MTSGGKATPTRCLFSSLRVTQKQSLTGTFCFFVARQKRCVSHLSINGTGRILPAGVTAELCTHAVPPSDEAAHCELQTVCPVQPTHSGWNLPAGSGDSHTPWIDQHTNPGERTSEVTHYQNREFVSLTIAISIFSLLYLKRQLLISETPQTALCALTFRRLCVQLCMRLGQLSPTAPVILQKFGQFVVLLSS